MTLRGVRYFVEPYLSPRGACDLVLLLGGGDRKGATLMRPGGPLVPRGRGPASERVETLRVVVVGFFDQRRDRGASTASDVGQPAQQADDDGAELRQAWKVVHGIEDGPGDTPGDIPETNAARSWGLSTAPHVLSSSRRPSVARSISAHALI